MSQINLPAQQPSIVSPLAPASPPSEAPANAAPPSGPLKDQNRVRTQQPQRPDLGPLPWDSPAEKAASPSATFTQSPEFQRLGEQEQATLEAFYAISSEGAEPKAARKIARQLGELLKQGKHEKADAFGGNLLDHLAAFNQAPLHASLESKTSKGQVARDLLKALSDPTGLGQGKRTSNCAEATLEATLAFGQPADYARIAVGLATKGEATIPGPPQGPHPDTLALNMMGEASGRSTLSFMMQRSFKAKVDERWSIWLKVKDFFGFEDKDKGLNANEVKMLYDGIIGKDHLTVFADPGVNLLPAIDHMLQRAPDGAIKATLRSEEGLHAVAVQAISSEGVTIWDPATGKTDILPKDVFNELLVRATFDREQVLEPTSDWQLRRTQHQIRMAATPEAGKEGREAIAAQEEGGGRLGGGGVRG